MSSRFDDDVAAAWQRFERRVAAKLAGFDDSFDVVRWHDGEVLLRAYDRDDSLLAYLDDPAEPQVRSAARALGWEPADDGEWWVEVPREQRAWLSALIVSTLRLTLGVTDPAFVFIGPDDVLVEPPADTEVAAEPGVAHAYPETSDELRDLIRQALSVDYGPEIHTDDDGDFPVHAGAAPLWVQPSSSAPIVRLFSFVVDHVHRPRQARLEMDILNRCTPLVKFHLQGEVIVASYELPAYPFASDQFLGTLDRFATTIGSVAGDLALRVGGEVWFPDISSSHDEAQGES